MPPSVQGSKMKFFKVKLAEEATNILMSIGDLYRIDTEIVELKNLTDRVLSEDIVSDTDIPEFNRSTVDGYALFSTESHGASESIPALVKSVGSVEMGKIAQSDIIKGETMYVPTGGMLPESADSVIMIEDTEQFTDCEIGLLKSVTFGENVIFKGDDIKKGEVALVKNKKLNSLDIGVLSALGISNAKVYKKPKVSIISTGDEIIDLTQSKNPGQIYDINGNVISSLVELSGAEVVEHIIVKDDYNELFNTVHQAAKNSDLVILSGGSSVGTRDYTYKVIDNLSNSQILVEGLNIKPGKPTIIGTGNGVTIFGLPGHPVSSIIVYNNFVDPYIKRLLKQKPKKYDFIGTLTTNIHSSPGKTTYQMVITDGDIENLTVTPKHGKSGMISLLSKSSGYIVIESHKEGLNKGDKVKGYYFG